MRLFAHRKPDQQVLELLKESGHNATRATRMLNELLAGFPDRSELAREILLSEQVGDRIAHDTIYRVAECGSRHICGRDGAWIGPCLADPLGEL